MKKSFAIQELGRMDFEAKLALYPNTKKEWIPETKFTQTKANTLATCILRFCQLQGHQAERISIISRQINGKFVKSNMQIGSADLSICLWNGKGLKVEIKIGDDKQSEAQKKYQQQIEASGALYFIARDFDSFYEYYQELKKAHS